MGVTNTSLHFLPDFLPHRNPLHRKRACRLLEKPRSTSVWNLRRIVNKNWIQKDCDLNRFYRSIHVSSSPLPSFILITINHHHHDHYHRLSSTSSSSSILASPLAQHHSVSWCHPRYPHHPPTCTTETEKGANISLLFFGAGANFGHFHA